MDDCQASCDDVGDDDDDFGFSSSACPPTVWRLISNPGSFSADEYREQHREIWGWDPGEDDWAEWAADRPTEDNDFARGDA